MFLPALCVSRAQANTKIPRFARDDKFFARDDKFFARDDDAFGGIASFAK
jgi:hypothetical protein